MDRLETLIPWRTNESDREGRVEVSGLWVRPALRPSWGRQDADWWWAVDPDWRLPVGDEIGRRCSALHCENECWLVRVEKITSWRRRTSWTRRSFRCPAHVYGELVEAGGQVLHRRPRYFAQAA